ncbi:uncharacterized protein LY89DRAFT_732662 [Mollisia scopiformis]|uniref:Phosphoglycerate mutase-like protein n=1 Tax=Mollisia scopiformis TaxID=149040 RepID=A0A194XCS0_MOLSC|nr:uncharacterized protein LY89DRAFT_732662 [Mollisia scopiformis]KUJ17959.1 hypothetical protein LY89DRAFT_732662 [Mollisia scopiformis]
MENATPNIIVHFMRHAEPAHKCGGIDDLTMLDPDISYNGRLQCLAFSSAIAPDLEQHVTHIFSSPMLRALTTTCIALWPLLRKGLTVHALPELQNLDMGPSGTGMNVSDLDKEFTGNFGLLGGKDRKSVVDVKTFMAKDWNSKETGSWSTPEVEWRVDYMRGFLKGLLAGRERVEVVIVSHGSFLRKLVNDVKFQDVVLTSCVFGEDGKFEEISQDKLGDLRKQMKE